MDIINGVDNLIRSGNLSAIFGPVVNHHLSSSAGLSPSDQSVFLLREPEEVLRTGAFKRVPVMAGVVAAEGIIMAYFLKERMDTIKSVRDMR